MVVSGSFNHLSLPETTMIPVAKPSSTNLIKSFITSNIPEVKRISKGMIQLMELFIQFKKRNVKIGKDDEVFIPVNEMKKLCHHNYISFREACFKMKGFHSRLEGKCDRITGYTDAFDALFINLIILNRLSWYTKELDNKNHNSELIGTVSPGADPMNYTQTSTSARHYIWLQNLSREDKSQIYSGLHDIDIVGCFPNIFFNEMLKGVSNNQHMNLMVKHPDDFLQFCIGDNIYKKLYPQGTLIGRDAAKVVRSRLFHPPKSGRRPRRSGVEWYDTLSDYIYDVLKGAGISDPHLYFTSIEQRVIDLAIKGMGEQHVVLRIHDGFIAKDITDADNLLDCLQSITGYKWSCKLL